MFVRQHDKLTVNVTFSHPSVTEQGIRLEPASKVVQPASLIRLEKHTERQTRSHRRAHTHTHTLVHTHRQTHTHTQAHTHTHTHTHSQTDKHRAAHVTIHLAAP